MTIYKVEQNRLSYDYGHVVGTVVVGYYSTKEKPKRQKKKLKKRIKSFGERFTLKKLK